MKLNKSFFTASGRRKAFFRGAALILALLAALAALTSCGSGREGSESASAPGGQSTAAEASESLTKSAGSDPEGSLPESAESSSDGSLPESAESGSGGGTTESAESSADGGTTEPEKVFSPLMWRARDDQGHEMLLFGTIHVGDERSGRVLEQVRPYLESCDALAVEFDVTAYEKDWEAQIRTVSRFVLTDGTTIKDHISEKLYENMVKLLVYGGIYNPALDNYNSAFWLQMATEALMSKCNLTSDYMMDRLLINLSHEQGREVRDVESADFQMELLAQASEEYNVLAMTQMLRQAKHFNESLNLMYESWLSGNETLLLQAAVTAEDPTFTKEENEILNGFSVKLLNERNVGMAQKAKEWLEKGDRVFFAVGAAHFLGDGGIVSLLQKQGFTVERIEF